MAKRGGGGKRGGRGGGGARGGRSYRSGARSRAGTHGSANRRIPFTSSELHDLVDSDIWVIEQILTLPSDPTARVTSPEDGAVTLEVGETVAMPQMREAVANYRRRILPVIFLLAQKVYAELFRLMLAHNNLFAGWKQSLVEVELRGLWRAVLYQNSLRFPTGPLFKNGGQASTITRNVATLGIKWSTERIRSLRGALRSVTRVVLCSTGRKMRFSLSPRMSFKCQRAHRNSVGSCIKNCAWAG